MSQVRKYQNAGKLDLPTTGSVIDPAKKSKLKFKVNGQDLELDEDEFRGMYDSTFKDFTTRGWATEKNSQSWGNTFEKIIDNARKGTYSFNTTGEDATNVDYKDNDGEGGAGENSTLGLNKKGKTTSFGVWDNMFGGIKDEAKQASLLNHKIGEFVANKYKGLKTQDEKDKEWLGKVDFITSMGDYQKSSQGAGSKSFLDQFWEKDDKDNSGRERYISQYINQNAKLNELMKPENQKYMQLLTKEKNINFDKIKSIQTRFAQNGYKGTADDLREFSEAIGHGNTNYDYYNRNLSQTEKDKLKADADAKLATDNAAKTNATNTAKTNAENAIAAAKANIVNGQDMRLQLGDRNGKFAIGTRNNDMYEPVWIADGKEVDYDNWVKYASKHEDANKVIATYLQNYRGMLQNNVPTLEKHGYIHNFDDYISHPDGQNEDDFVARTLKTSGKIPFQMGRNLTGHYTQSPFFQQKDWNNGSIFEGMEETKAPGIYRRIAYMINNTGKTYKGRLENGIFQVNDGKTKFNVGALPIKDSDQRLRNFTLRFNSAIQEKKPGIMRKDNNPKQLYTTPVNIASNFLNSIGDSVNDVFSPVVKKQSKKQIAKNQKGGKILKFQKGGPTSTKEVNTMKRVFDGNASNTDQMRAIALLGDISSLGLAFVPGANVAAAATGAVTTGIDFAADVKQDGLDWGDAGRAGIGLALDAATLIPGIGGIAKSAKVMKNIKAAAPWLSRALGAAGLVAAANVINKKVSTGQDLSIADYRTLTMGLMGLRGGLGLRATGKAIKVGKTAESLTASVKSKVKNEAGEFVEGIKEIKIPLRQEQFAELSKLKKGPDQIVAANKMANDAVKSMPEFKGHEISDIKVNTDVRSRLNAPLTKKANRESITINKSEVDSWDMRTPSEATGTLDKLLLNYAKYRGVRPRTMSGTTTSANDLSDKVVTSAADKANDIIKSARLRKAQDLTKGPIILPSSKNVYTPSSAIKPSEAVTNVNPNIQYGRTFNRGDRVIRPTETGVARNKGIFLNNTKTASPYFKKGGSLVKSFKSGGSSATPGNGVLDPIRKTGKWLSDNVSGSDVLALSRMLAVTNVNKNYDTRSERPIMQHAAEPVKTVSGNAMISHAYNQGANQTMQTAKNMLGSDNTANKLLMLSANDNANKMRIEGSLKNAEVIDQSRNEAEQLAMQAAGARSQIANQNTQTLAQASQAEREAINLKNKLVAQPTIQWMQGKEAEMKLNEQQDKQLDGKIAGANAEFRLSSHPEYLKDKAKFDNLSQIRANLMAKNSDLDSTQMTEYNDLNSRLSNAKNLVNVFSYKLARDPKLDINAFFKANKGIYQFSGNSYGKGGTLSIDDKMKIEQNKINYKSNQDYIKNYLTLLKENRTSNRHDIESSLKKINILIKNALEV